MEVLELINGIVNDLYTIKRKYLDTSGWSKETLRLLFKSIVDVENLEERLIQDLFKFKEEIKQEIVPLKKHDIQPIPILIQLGKNSRRFAVIYSKQKIGTIRPGIDCWIASASIHCGAIEYKLFTRKEAINWLVKNFLRIDRSGIKLIVNCENCHYIVENDSWRIEIDVFDDYCRSIAMQNEVKSEYRYFPDLNSAIACSFTQIMNPEATIGIRSIEEF